MTGRLCLKVSFDEEAAQTIISGMGELHLDIYVERMKREYKVEVDVGKPRVNFREAITKRANFDYLHRKQSGGFLYPINVVLGQQVKPTLMLQLRH